MSSWLHLHGLDGWLWQAEQPRGMAEPSLLAVAVESEEKPWPLSSPLQPPSQCCKMEVGKGSTGLKVQSIPRLTLLLHQQNRTSV